MGMKMNVGPALNGGIGMEKETPSVEDAEEQVAAALTGAFVVLAQVKESDNPEVKAFRAQVLTEALGTAMGAGYEYQSATAKEAKESLRAEPPAAE